MNDLVTHVPWVTREHAEGSWGHVGQWSEQPWENSCTENPQVRVLAWAAISFSKVGLLLLLLLLSRFSRVQLCATPKTAAHQGPPSLGFSRQQHWSPCREGPSLLEAEAAPAPGTRRPYRWFRLTSEGSASPQKL